MRKSSATGSKMRWMPSCLTCFWLGEGFPGFDSSPITLAEVEVRPDPISGIPMTEDGAPAPIEEVEEKKGRFMWNREGDDQRADDYRLRPLGRLRPLA